MERPATSAPAREAPSRVGPYRVVGYHPWWTRDVWRTYDYEVLDEIFFFDIEVAGSGAFRDRHGWPDRWVSMRSYALERGTPVVPTVTLFKPSIFESLFTSEDSSRTLLRNLLALIDDSPGLGGLHIDFEVFRAVKPEARDGFTAFVRTLRRELQARDRQLTLSLFMPAFDWGEVYDETTLASYADYFVVQGYDLHARNEERAGPVAALEGWGKRNWRAIVDRYLALGVPREKIVMAVPYFGYEWPTEDAAPGAPTRGPGVSTTYAPVDTLYLPGKRKAARLQAETYGLQRDAQSGSPYYVYQDSTGYRQGWFEDAQSLEAKYAFVREERLGGVAIFPLGYGDERLGDVLRRAFLGQ